MDRLLRTARTALAAAIAVSLLTAGSAAAAPAIEITGPAAGTVIDRSQTPTITITGGSAFDEPVPSTRTFYARRDSCIGVNSDLPRLSVEQGTDGGDGCGHAVGPAASPATQTFSAADGLPLELDATRTAKGAVTVSASSTMGVQRTALGQVKITTTLTAMVAGAQATLGSAVSEHLMLPDAQTATAPFEFAIDPALNKKPVTAITLSVKLEGPSVSVAVKHSGTTFVEMPFLDHGTVFVGVGSAAAAPGAKIAAAVKPDGTWDVTIQTPFPGSKKIHARAVQGVEQVWATPVPISVVF